MIATGGIDFSIGPVMFCCALVSGYSLTAHGVPMGAAIVISIFVGLAFGLFNGYLVAYWSVPSFITSMASMNIAKGLASVFTKTQSVSWPQATAEGGWYRSLIKVRRYSGGAVHFPCSSHCLCDHLKQDKDRDVSLHLEATKKRFGFPVWM